MEFVTPRWLWRKAVQYIADAIAVFPPHRECCKDGEDFFQLITVMKRMNYSINRIREWIIFQVSCFVGRINIDQSYG